MTESMARRIDRSMAALAGADDLAELEEQFLQESGRLLAADCLCWNTWAPDWSTMIRCRSNEEHDRWLATHHEVFSHYIGLHPVLANNHISATATEVMRMSDFESPASFRENPFYREVYQPLGFLYQICHTAASLEDRKIILTWSRGTLDFSDLDKQIFHRMSTRLGLISSSVATRERLLKTWNALSEFVGSRSPSLPPARLETSEAILLTQLFRHPSRQTIARHLKVRRDSLDKKLGAIRERLGLENHHQLLSALAELKAGRTD